MVLKKEIADQIKDLLHKNPQGLNITEIVSDIKINRNTVVRYLENLLISGHVDMSHLGMVKIYKISERNLAEENLKYSERKFAAAFEASPNPMAITVVQTGVILDVNSAFEEWSGYLREDLSGKTTTELNFWVYPEERDAFVQQLKIHGIFHKKEVTFRIKNGNIRNILFSAKLFGAGYNTYMLSVAEDITERKKADKALADSEEKYRLIVENSRDLIYTLNTAGEFVYISPSVTSILGYSPQDLIGCSFISYIHPDDLPVVQEIFQRLFKENFKSQGTEYRVLHASGEWRWQITRGGVVRDSAGNMLYFSGIANDITEDKRLQKALEQAKKKINLLNFVTFKDIQNFIFILSSYQYLIKEKVPEKAILSIIDKQTDILQKITDTLKFAQSYQDLGVKPPKWQNINNVFLLAISHLDFLKIKHSILFDDLEIFADPLLEQVFQILADNILEHGKTATEILFRYTETQKSLTLFFEDNGVGIPEDIKKEIFSSEFQIKKHAGLFLAKEILEITGISIKETGTPGMGARFEMTVPKDVYRFTKMD